MPVRAIAACLQIACLDIRDVDVVALPTEVEVWPLNDVFELYGGPHEQGRNMTRAAQVAHRLAGGSGAPAGAPAADALRFRSHAAPSSSR